MFSQRIRIKNKETRPKFRIINRSEIQIKYSTWIVFTWRESARPAQHGGPLSAVKTALFIDTAAQWGVIESIFYGVCARWTRTHPMSKGASETVSSPPLLPVRLLPPGVAVFNGSGNRGWLSICGQLGTISWHREGGEGPLGERREGESRNPRSIRNPVSDKTRLLLDKVSW